MKRKFDRVYQFKITLKGIRPPIWRRIQVPETYTFWDLHVAIQDVMGWQDYHLHQFEMVNPATGNLKLIGLPADDYDWTRATLAGWRQKIAQWFTPENKVAVYLYDFGDGWEHKVELEKILPREAGVRYPICLGGERACPPEDCGGIPGYERLLEIISNPDDEEYEEMLMWLGGKFDPEQFDPKKVLFGDPAIRFKKAFEEE
ncbi:MAG: hypothetical protein PWP57_310 [Candidatus Atribacteria bacterium]|nr:hypothetical protein [Candidatus Atribacteria bacterium]